MSKVSRRTARTKAHPVRMQSGDHACVGPHPPFSPRPFSVRDEPTSPSEFSLSPIAGVVIRELTIHSDARGWLAEWWRSDDHDAVHQPCMGYTSVTEPGVTRGPHEHRDQSDAFVFLGPGEFLLYLWDNRPLSPTYGCRMCEPAGQQRPISVVVPPGVVHAYRNVGESQGWVLNVPNRLYRGPGRSQPIDEIRHELDPATPFLFDVVPQR
jgi:dTDP-4-dehydrorhamnose 3,5-epimerase